MALKHCHSAALAADGAIGRHIPCVLPLHSFKARFSFTVCVRAPACVGGSLPALSSLQHPLLRGSISSGRLAGQVTTRLGSFPSQRATTTIRAHFFAASRGAFCPKVGALPPCSLPPPWVSPCLGHCVFGQDRFGLSLTSSPFCETKH